MFFRSIKQDKIRLLEEEIWALTQDIAKEKDEFIANSLKEGWIEFDHYGSDARSGRYRKYLFQPCVKINIEYPHMTQEEFREWVWTSLYSYQFWDMGLYKQSEKVCK